VREPPRPPPVTETPRAPEGDASTTWRWTGAGLAAAGVVAVGAGLYLVLGAKGDYDSVSSQCTPNGCTPPAESTRHGAYVRAGTATIVTSAGIAAIATGGVFWFVLGRKTDAGSAKVGVGPTSVSVLVPLCF
jgi:hypothetical protein